MATHHLAPPPPGKLYNQVTVIVLLPFSTADGSAYVLGKLNGEHWYLYMTEKPEKKYGRGPLALVVDG